MTQTTAHHKAKPLRRAHATPAEPVARILSPTEEEHQGKRGAPVLEGSYQRLEIRMSQEDFDTLVNLKAVIGATTLSQVVRTALRGLTVQAVTFGKDYDFYAVKRSNPKDKTKFTNLF